MSLVGLLIHIIGLMALIAISVGSIERLSISPRAMAIAKGMPYGLAACAAMITPVILSDGTVLNGRSLFLAFSGAFGGIGAFATATAVASIGISQLTNVGFIDTLRPTLLAGVIGLFWHFIVYPRLGMKVVGLRSWCNGLGTGASSIRYPLRPR